MGAMYIELHYIFATLWGHRVYTLFGVLTVAVIILIIVACFVTVSLTYFTLMSEDYRWWWSSFINGGSTGLFVFFYSCFYFYRRSEMNGSLQTSFFFGYMLMASYAFFLVLGTVGYYSSF